MTNEQAKKMLAAKLECLKRETSGTDFDCNNSNCDECSLCYEQGNMGEQKEALDMAIKALEQQHLNPEADREESKAYCAECDHIEMCSWYPHDGCEWLKTDRYNAGYNAAKREIALSGEYERAYERGKADAHPDINDGKLSEIPTGSEREDKE